MKYKKILLNICHNHNKTNISSRYLQSYDDRKSLFKIKYSFKYSDDVEDCLKRLILENDIEE